MKGSSCRTALRIRVVVVFAAAFLAGATAIFGLAALVGTALRRSDLPVQWRVIAAAAGLVALALVDVLAVGRNRYCPLGLRRQTPKSLERRYAVTTVAAVWGFDTGLAVTTFRVAAITWGALGLVGLGLSAWWIGLAYGLGFILPLLASIAMQAPDARPDGGIVLGASLERMLARRPLVQRVSAVVLCLTGAVLLIRLVA